MSSEPIAVVGAGPAGLMAAQRLAEAGLSVTLYDRMPSPARKFLMAGRGGLNLTHSEPFERFLARYGAAAPHLAAALRAFPPEALREWAAGLGEETFVGSSGRVFPKSFKASPVLRAWLRHLAGLGVRLAARHAFLGFADDGALRFATPEGERQVAAPAVILALGGASWPRLGADGGWVDLLRRQNITVASLEPANMGVRVAWSPVFRDRFAGTPLKRIALSCGAERARGEAVVTQDGLEGGAVYALSRTIREASKAGPVALAVDLRPDLDAAALAARLSAAPKKLSFAERLRKAAGLSPVAAGLVREALIGATGRPEGAALAALVKAVPLTVTGVAGLERAISSAGGVAFEEVDARFMLVKRPGIFVCGEMLDWEAPTGGYLLQACFATGRAAAEGVIARLEHVPIRLDHQSDR